MTEPLGTVTLADALPQEINRVRELQDQLKDLRGLPNVIVEPQIAMMEADIQVALAATASQDVVAMIRACEALRKWEG